jgi:hypothetical protein
MFSRLEWRKVLGWMNNGEGYIGKVQMKMIIFGVDNQLIPLLLLLSNTNISMG